jgi:chromate transporter
LPGLIILTLCGALIDAFVDPNSPPWYLIGLPPAAISLVFKAFYGFAIKLDSLGIILALCSCLVAIVLNNDDDIDPASSQWVFPTTLALGGLVTYLDSKREKPFATYASPGKGWDKDSDETMKRKSTHEPELYFRGVACNNDWLTLILSFFLQIQALAFRYGLVP